MSTRPQQKQVFELVGRLVMQRLPSQHLHG